MTFFGQIHPYTVRENLNPRVPRARDLPENVGDASAGIGTIIPAFEGYLRSRVLTVFWEILSVANSTLISFKV